METKRQSRINLPRVEVLDEVLDDEDDVWDRNQIHSKAKVVKAWLAKHPGVVAEDFPGYVPDLNPDEGVWGWAKYGRLADLAARDKDELWDRVVEELVEVKFRSDLLRGFIRQTGLPGVTLAA
jgi:hypothetical protein